MKMVPRVREILERYRVPEEAGEEILSAAVQEATYRAGEPGELEKRMLRAVERRARAWREERDAADDGVETNDPGKGEQRR